MRKSIIAVILITMLALAGTTGNAFAWSNSMTTPVASGSRVCFSSSQQAFSQVHLLGTSDRATRFTIHRSADGFTYQDVSQSSDDARIYNNYFYAGVNPYFPNFFKICARNLSAKSATVTLLIETDASVH
jgi:hypothetical protein